MKEEKSRAQKKSNRGSRTEEVKGTSEKRRTEEKIFESAQFLEEKFRKANVTEKPNTEKRGKSPMDSIVQKRVSMM